MIVVISMHNLLISTEKKKKFMIDCRDHRLLSLFRFKIWWMIPRMGTSASDVPIETQMLLLEATEHINSIVDGYCLGPSKGKTSYILLLPGLDGPFRTSLQGNSSDELEFCIESGSHLIDLLRYCLLELYTFFVQYLMLG